MVSIVSCHCGSPFWFITVAYYCRLPPWIAIVACNCGLWIAMAPFQWKISTVDCSPNPASSRIAGEPRRTLLSLNIVLKWWVFFSIVKLFFFHDSPQSNTLRTVWWISISLRIYTDKILGELSADCRRPALKRPKRRRVWSVCAIPNWNFQCLKCEPL